MTTNEAPFTHARSGMAPENIQEVLDSDARGSTKLDYLMNGGQQQYTTPEWLAKAGQARLPNAHPSTVFDPQVGEGDLVNTGSWGTTKFGCDIDNRLSGRIPGVHLATGNCVKIMEALDDLAPDARFECANANPPFGKRWKLADGRVVDSTEWTWQQVTKRANYGYFIANHTTLTKLGIDKHPLVFHYETHEGNDLWKGMRAGLQIGVAFWRQPEPEPVTPSSEMISLWEDVARIADEERISRPPFNIFLDKSGYLKTYLSYRSELKLKLKREAIQMLHRINDCHPLTLTTEKESRDLLNVLVSCGVYTVQPEARKAIESALAEMQALACPIMPPSDFETVAYADEEDELECVESVNKDGLCFTKGTRYKLTTGTYRFVEKFKRKKVHLDETTLTQFTVEHDWTRHGTDRYIQFVNDAGNTNRFMDRPVHTGLDFDEGLLWKYFTKPKVKTITDTCREVVEQNLAVLRSCEMLAGYDYYPGQLQYIARVGAKTSALVAGATGTGKTLMAISLLAMKGPKRALIVAPQATMRSSSSTDEDDDEEAGGEGMGAAQWIQEIQRFAPYMQIWELFSYEDYERIRSLNGGELPVGVYVTYYEAFFKNKAREKVPDSWTDKRLNKFLNTEYGLPSLPEVDVEQFGDRFWCKSVGKEVNGIRSVITPCLSSLIGDQFDMVCLDEAHVGCNMDALITQMIIRLQPHYRFAFTATPIPNIVSNLFSLMGWLAVPGWYKGGVRNAAWPYAREELARFDATFLSQERDHTQEAMNRKADPKWSGSCVRNSPVIASPARLLKLLKPTMGFISKEMCNPAYTPPKIVDVRVPMGKSQAALYGHYLNRGNVPGGHPLVRARRQTAWLRNICADPAGFRHGGPAVASNMNPKVMMILQLVREILAEREQVVIINSRKGITDTIQTLLVEAGISVARIDSSLTTEQHSRQSNLFKEKRAQVMLMGIKCAASHSFSLCKYEIISSLEYSNGPFDQAKGRVDRVNSRPGVTIYCILFKDSIEEVMFDTVATKDDAATICLKGKRIPREFKPVDPSEVLATSIERFDLSGATPETECESQWPLLRERIRSSLPLTLSSI